MAEIIRVALVTGGFKGIGYGVAESLIHHGVRVAITSRSQAAADAAGARLNALRPGYALGLAADVRSLDAQQAAVAEVLRHWGRIDYVVANAGVGHFAPIQTMTAAQWQETIDINLTGVFYTVKATLAALRASEGYFISIASLAGTNFFENGAAYNASKFGLVGFSQAIMLDLRSEGIKVTTIMPGSVATEFGDHAVTDQDGWKIQPEDLGQLVVDLIRMPARTLPSKVEVRPTVPGGHKKPAA